MHDQIIGTIGMDQASHIAHDNNTYGNNNWVDMNSFHHQTTMADYGGSYGGYMPPISHGLPSESLGRMPPPPPPQHHVPQPHQHSHPPLPMLMMPQTTTTWPSMLTNPTYGTHPVPPVAIPPVTTPLKNSKLPAIQTTSQPRKTLTDEDRRRMCQYAQDHPTAKQTDIGAQFGVERSTVSKVLRHRDKYLNLEDRSNSPIKRNKVKGADIEKALTNFLKKSVDQGVPVTVEILKDKAHLFASSAGSAGDEFLKLGSTTWLEKFMLKHNTGPNRLLRRASEANISSSMRGSSEGEKDNMASYMDYSTENSYKHSGSQSATSLHSAFTDAGASTFSGSTLSPTASFGFSPDPNAGAFLTSDQARQLPPGSSVGSNFQRPRSQTFPTLDIEYLNQQESGDGLTPKYHVSSTGPSSGLESPANEVGPSHFGMDHIITSPRLRHSSSSGSLAGRSIASPLSANPTSPISPTQEDARRAADTLLSFMQHSGGLVDHDEYMTVVKLTEKLRLHQAQLAKNTAVGMGGLSRIPEGDSEMQNAAPASAIKVEQAMGA
ncbi:hypothetical protein B0T09DRAFT_356266 [Sordaria sp. MPI-SDFR-AT-0083]|nr:hypothetical protein B0T09DRAFT_356266 [Sordaria sp. MPI-SDFR-AT-0083]